MPRVTVVIHRSHHYERNYQCDLFCIKCEWKFSIDKISMPFEEKICLYKSLINQFKFSTASLLSLQQKYTYERNETASPFDLFFELNRKVD